MVWTQDGGKQAFFKARIPMLVNVVVITGFDQALRELWEDQSISKEGKASRSHSRGTKEPTKRLHEIKSAQCDDLGAS